MCYCAGSLCETSVATILEVMARQKNDGLGRLGGRAKGTPNKVTVELRDKFRKFAQDNFATFETEWKGLEAKDKCQVFIDICKFVVPSLSSVELNDVTDNRSEIEDALKSLRDEQEIV